MDDSPLSVLLVEDDQRFADMVTEVLASAPEGMRRFVVRRADRLAAAVQMLREFTFQLILLDLTLPDSHGLATFRQVLETAPHTPILIITGADHESWAQEAMRAGAQDYLVKAHFDIHTLHRAAGYAIERHRLRQELEASHDDLEMRVAARTGELAAANAALQREVAERRRAEEELRRTVDQLARSNIELERFAYVASHDLREPLRLVVNYCDLLGKRCASQLDPQSQRYIRFAIDAASRLYEMVGSLLDYSRLDVHSDSCQPVNCNELLYSIIEEFQLAIEESQAHLEWEDLPTINADSLLLRQVFQNLIGNALKFRSESPPHIRVLSRRLTGEWQFTVQDNGIGMAADDAERVFHIFRRLHRPSAYPGAGIGLAVCKKIVEHYGGKVWVESEAGKGASFHFTLPDLDTADSLVPPSG